MSEQQQDPLIEEALRWFGVLKDPKASEDDRRAFSLWLKEKPEHEAAWRQAQRVWMRVGKIGPAFANSPQATVVIPAPAPVVTRRPPPLRANPSLRPVASRRPPPKRRGLIAAVATACVAAPAGALLWRPGWLADHATAIGERRTVILPDGSTVELAGASSISVDFAAGLRRVVLDEGEAFFKVAADANRPPFVVEADGARVRALGTAFDVKLGDGGVTIAVSEQSVDVTVDGRPPVVVGSGQQVRAGRRMLGDVREADLARVEAWRQDRLTFQETRLGDVVADLQRYRIGRIVLTEARLGDIPVSAAFEASQADAAIDTLAATLPIRVRRFTPLLVVLSPQS